ncbi:MAG: hypothetical protein A3F09_04045 [Chlamydiae bacterium RIFCSPHIGHO2_12_FULL_49_11]|nr:MAG: hypothetical protein A3F09_04045 [Chlamydiae bacterium RIFCSPHIGHO2_12_FULL_49_11]
MQEGKTTNPLNSKIGIKTRIRLKTKTGTFSLALNNLRKIAINKINETIAKEKAKKRHSRKT